MGVEDHRGAGQAGSEPPADAPYQPFILPFDVWAHASSRVALLEIEARLNILDEMDVDPRDLEASDIHWGLSIAADLEKGDHTRANDYGKRCAEEMQRRRAAATAQPAATAEPASPPAKPPVPSPPLPLPHVASAGGAPQATVEMPALFIPNPTLPFGGKKPT